MAGRYPKVTALRVLEGNREHRPLPKDEPQFAPGVPEMPPSLDADAREEWERVVPELVALNLVTPINRSALEVMCRTFGAWRRSMKALESGKLGAREYANKRRECKEHVETLRQYQIQFGLTPSAKVRLNGAGKPADTGDSLDRLLARRKKA